MKKLFLWLVLFLFFPLTGCFSQLQKDTPNKEPVPDNFSWNFGKVKEGQRLEHDFLLKNETDKTLNIKDINTSCGGTASNIEKKTILPQESVKIEVQFNSKGYLGPVKQFVYVNTDNLDNPVVRFIIEAQVEK